MSKLIMGVGINDAGYKIHIVEQVNGKPKTIWRCPYYRKWESMLTRCYSNKYQNLQRSYEGCQVCESWKVFSVFKEWCTYKEKCLGISVEDYELDKDIFSLDVKGSLYAPELCCFVTTAVNGFATNVSSSESKKNTHGLLLGVTPSGGKSKPYKSNMRFNKKYLYMGVYSTEEEAHKVYCETRLKCLHELLQEGHFNHDITIYEKLLEKEMLSYQKSCNLLNEKLNIDK